MRNSLRLEDPSKSSNKIGDNNKRQSQYQPKFGSNDGKPMSSTTNEKDVTKKPIIGKQLNNQDRPKSTEIENDPKTQSNNPYEDPSSKNERLATAENEDVNSANISIQSSSQDDSITFKLPVSILAFEVLSSTYKQCAKKARSTEFTLHLTIGQNTYISAVFSKETIIDWDTKIIKMIDQTARIDEINIVITAVNEGKAPLKSSINETNDQNNVNDKLTQKLKMNIMNEIKIGALFPKVYKMDDGEDEVLIDVKLLRIYPTQRPWNTYNDVIFCFYVQNVTIDKPQEFTKEYFVRVELKNTKERQKIEHYQQTRRRPFVGEQIRINNWIFLKIDLTRDEPLLRIALCDANTRKIQGGRLFLPASGNPTPRKDTASGSSAEKDKYMVNQGSSMNRKKITSSSTKNPKEGSVEGNNAEKIGSDPLLVPGASLSHMKQVSTVLMSKNDPIGEIHFCYGSFFSQ